MHAGCNFKRIDIRRTNQDKLGKSVFSKDRAGHTQDGLRRMMGVRNVRAMQDVCYNEVRPTAPSADGPRAAAPCSVSLPTKVSVNTGGPD